MPTFHGPERVKAVSVLAPATDAAGRTGAYVNVSLSGSIVLRCLVNQGNAATVQFTVKQAQDNAGTGVKNLAGVVPVYANLNTSTNDTDVRQSDAASFTTDVATQNKIVTFLIKPSDLDIANGFKYVTITTGASNVANITAAVAEAFELRYAQATPPSLVA